MGKLTKSAIDRLKQPKLHGDGDGLYLQIKEGRDGLRKSWLFRFQLPGARPRAMGLGSYPDVDLDAAREAARLARQLVAKGVDPIVDRERAAAQAEVYNITYREAVARYAETMTPKWKRGAANFLWAQDKHVLPVLGGVRVTDITTQDVLQVFKPKWDKIPHMMWDTLHYVKHVLAFVRANGWSDPEKPNPAEWVGHLQHLLPQVPHSRKALHRPSLPWRQVPKFIVRMREMANRDGQGDRSERRVSAACIEFQILCAVRPSEARLAEWCEIDLDARVWNIPGEKMKAGKPHRVALSASALRLLEARPRCSRYVFSKTTLRNRLDEPLHLQSGMNLMRELGFVDENGRRIVRHGFRTSFSTFAREATGYNRDIIEMALAHEVKTTVEAAYFRGDYLEQRRPLMEDWGRVCMGEWTTGEVVPIRGRSA
jgi:integrase